MEKQIIKPEVYYKNWLESIGNNYGDEVQIEVKKRIQKILDTEYKDIITNVTNLRLLALSKCTDRVNISDFMESQLNASYESYTDTFQINDENDYRYSTLYVLGFDIVIARWS